MQDAKRIGFIDDIAVVMRNDVELIQRAFADAGQKSFPDTGTAARLKGMRSWVPSIEAAYYGHGTRIRRPNSEAGSWLITNGRDVRAQLVIDPVMCSFVKEMEILVSQQADIRPRQCLCSFLVHH